MISSDNVIELLREVSDENLRNKILEMTSSQVSSSKSFKKPKKSEILNYNLSPYSLQEVFSRLGKRKGHEYC